MCRFFAFYIFAVYAKHNERPKKLVYKIEAAEAVIIEKVKRGKSNARSAQGAKPDLLDK